MNRLTANVYDANAASARVLEKNGFLLEGWMRRAALKAGKIYDVCIYGKLHD
ncbi:MAG: GNAT family N-acetyltransferase [Acetatifactor sp.]